MRYSYAELAALVAVYEDLLRERLALSRGEVVAAWLGNCPEFAACLLAVAATGAAMLPLNPGWRVPELQLVLDRLPVRGVVTKGALGDLWDDLSERVPAERLIEVDAPAIRRRYRSSGGLRPAEPSSPVDVALPAYYVASSGSTGTPKIVARSHRLVVESTAAVAQAMVVTSESVFASVTPFYTAGGLSASLLLPLLSGATAVLLPAFTPATFLAAIRRHHVDVFVGSPAMFELLVRYGSDLEPLASLEVCVSGGAPLAPQTAVEIQRRCGVAIRQMYGSSETGITAVEPAGGGAMLPVEGVTFRVLDPDGRPRAPGEEGEIEIARAGMTAGYVGGENAAGLSGGVYRSGDRGRLDYEGGLTVLSRIRPSINIGGTKVDAVALENVILALPGVSSCRVSSAQGAGALEVVKAVVAIEEGAELTRADVIRHCRGRLAEYEIPRIVELVPSPPFDPTGKRALPWGA